MDAAKETGILSITSPALTLIPGKPVAIPDFIEELDSTKNNQCEQGKDSKDPKRYKSGH
jgi:hypothetical protein